MSMPIHGQRFEGRPYECPIPGCGETCWSELDNEECPRHGVYMVPAED